VGFLATDWGTLQNSVLGPIHFSTRSLSVTRFGFHAMQPSSHLANTISNPNLLALFSRVWQRIPLCRLNLGALYDRLVLAALAHVTGWPIAKGGSQRIASALASYLRSLGGDIVTGVRVRSLKELPPSRIVLCDLSPRGLLEIAGEIFPTSYTRALNRYKYGPGVFKIDWALRAPIPWRAPQCARAGTVHLGGTLAEITRSERSSWRNEHSERPFVLLSQPRLFDPSRAPAGFHTAWACCHVPSRGGTDMADRIEAQVERFAPDLGT